MSVGTAITMRVDSTTIGHFTVADRPRLVTTIRLLAERREPPLLNLFSRVKAASTRSTLRAVFGIHRRRLVESYSAHSLGCVFSEGIIDSRSEVSPSQHSPGFLGNPIAGPCRMSKGLSLIFRKEQALGAFWRIPLLPKSMRGAGETGELLLHACGDAKRFYKQRQVLLFGKALVRQAKLRHLALSPKRCS